MSVYILFSVVCIFCAVYSLSSCVSTCLKIKGIHLNRCFLLTNLFIHFMGPALSDSWFKFVHIKKLQAKDERFQICWNLKIRQTDVELVGAYTRIFSKFFFIYKNLSIHTLSYIP